MSGEDDSPLHEVLFSIEYNLCKEFPALSPWEIDERSYHTVIRLYSDTRRIQIRDQKLRDPDEVIRVKAGDNWF